MSQFNSEFEHEFKNLLLGDPEEQVSALTYFDTLISAGDSNAIKALHIKALQCLDASDFEQAYSIFSRISMAGDEHAQDWEQSFLLGELMSGGFDGTFSRGQ